MGRTTDLLKKQMAALQTRPSAEKRSGAPGLSSAAETIPRPSTPAESAPGPKNILLLLQDPLMILGTAAWLNKQPGFKVGRTSTDPAEAPEIIQNNSFDAIVCELSISGPFNFSFLKRLRAENRSLPILAFSAHEEVIFARRAVSEGANGYLMKNAPPESLTSALSALLRGETYLSKRLRARMVREEKAALQQLTGFLNGAKINSLTLQELILFHSLGEESKLSQIQAEMKLTEEEFLNLCESIQKKLGLGSPGQLLPAAFHWFYHEGDFG